MRPNLFSVSVNFRTTQKGSLWGNLQQAIGSGWPIGFLLRETFESATDYDEAVSWLTNSKLIAPCYFTICGVKPNEGIIITRRRKESEQPLELDVEPFLVQTNIDHWSDDPNEDIMVSIRRRKLAKRLLGNLMVQQTVNEEELWKLISNDPICNDITIYGTYICPSTAALVTRLPDPQGGFVL